MVIQNYTVSPCLSFCKIKTLQIFSCFDQWLCLQDLLQYTVFKHFLYFLSIQLLYAYAANKILKEQLVSVLLDKPYWSLTVRSCFSSLASSLFTDQRVQIEAQSSANPRQKSCSHTSPVYFPVPSTLPFFKYTKSPTIFFTLFLWNSISHVSKTCFHPLRIWKSFFLQLEAMLLFRIEKILTLV